MSSSLRNRLEAIKERCARASERSGRAPTDVRLVAVSKTVAPETVVEVYRLGQAEFGENRVQEFREKRPVLESAGVAATFHMLGHLQSNKAKLAVGLFDIIQSVDSLKLALMLSRESKEVGKTLPILLEVDFSPDPGRPGFGPGELDRAVDSIAALPGLSLQGLMTVAPLGLDPAGTREVFRQMADLRTRLSARYPSATWRHLSMGMSEDFEIAIEEGATIVRIGRAIFGDRV